MTKNGEYDNRLLLGRLVFFVFQPAGRPITLVPGAVRGRRGVGVGPLCCCTLVFLSYGVN